MRRMTHHAAVAAPGIHTAERSTPRSRHLRREAQLDLHEQEKGHQHQVEAFEREDDKCQRRRACICETPEAPHEEAEVVKDDAK